MFYLPANSSHLLQPLDLSLYWPLKLGWWRARAAFSHIPCTDVNQCNFAKIFNVAWNSCATPDMIRGGFRTAGIFPFTSAAFDYSKLATNICTTSATKASNLVGSQSPGSPSAKTNVTAPVSASPSTTSTGYTALPNYCDDSLSTANTGSSSTNGSMLFDDLTSLKKGLVRSERDKFRHGIKTYDVRGEDTYFCWQDLFFKLGGSGYTDEGCPFKRACSCLCAGFGYCSCVAVFIHHKHRLRNLAVHYRRHTLLLPLLVPLELIPPQHLWGM